MNNREKSYSLYSIWMDMRDARREKENILDMDGHERDPFFSFPTCIYFEGGAGNII